MKIFSWKINNLKKIIESESFKKLLESDNFDYDLICFQEIKYSNHEYLFDLYFPFFKILFGKWDYFLFLLVYLL